MALIGEGEDGAGRSGTGWVPSCRRLVGSSQLSVASCGCRLRPKSRGG